MSQNESGGVSLRLRRARPARSTVLFVVGVLAEMVGMASVPGTFHDSGDVTDFGVAYWLCAIALWSTVFFRARAPLAPALAGGILAVAGSSYVLLLIGLHHESIATRRRPIAPCIIAAAAVSAFVARELVSPWGDDLVLMLDLPASWQTSAGFAITGLGGFFALTALARSRQKSDEQRLRADVARDRADRLDEEVARRNERERIAREMHDALAHRLAVVALQGGAIEVALENGDPQAREIARSLRTEAGRSLDDLRGLLGELREGTANEHRDVAASMRSIGEVVRGARATGATVDATIIVDGVDRVAAVLDHTVFRLVQESTTNALKHAAGAPISIFVEASPASGVRVRVANALRGASAVAQRGANAGIVGMRERAERLNGEVWIGEHEGEFIVDASLPWLEVEPE